MIKDRSSSEKATRIKDIAEKAGVSKGTVDRVLHDRGRVAKEVKEKVLRIAEELNYKPNLHARALVSNRIYKIAALIPDSSYDEYWQAPLDGIEKAEAEFSQFGVVINKYKFNPFKAESFIKQAKSVTKSGYDGIITAPIFYKEFLPFSDQWEKQGIPFTLYNTNIPNCRPLAYIGQDSYQSGLLAAKLLQFGLSEPVSFVIAHIDEDVPNSSHLIKKEKGFNDYFEKFNDGNVKIIHEELSNCDNDALFYNQLDEILKRTLNLNGFFVTTSKAFTIASYLKSRNKKNIKLIGYDLLQKNIDFLNEGYIDFLINQNPKGQGYYGVQFLADHLVFKKEIPSIKYLPLDIITSENLAYYIDNDIQSN